ncbi:hypothetical protein FEV09_23900, partial [Pseudanabaena catenata USMAC16]|nr:hypothetical protein [Pseudanabaena catenata USMAC16]
LLYVGVFLWLVAISSQSPQTQKHGRLPKSLFRLGFDFLRHIIFDLHLNSEAFLTRLNFCPVLRKI